eukprot:8195388-Pyramimonas_sp.AAC.1
MAREAIKHLNIIVRQYRKLSGRRGNKREGGGTRNKPDQAPPLRDYPLAPRKLGGEQASRGSTRQPGKALTE